MGFWPLAVVHAATRSRRAAALPSPAPAAPQRRAPVDDRSRSPSQRGGFGSSAGEHGGRRRAEHAARSRRHRVPAGRTSSSSSASTTTCMDGKAYWTEQACYAFSSDEVDQLEAATETLHGLCLKAVEHVVVEQAVGAHAHPAGLGRLHRDACGGAPTRRSAAASTSPTTARARPSCSSTTPTRRRRCSRPPSSSGTG